MRTKIAEKVKGWFIRLLLKNSLLSGEKGSNGAGIWARNNTSGISDFHYRYDGTIGGDNYSYRVSIKDGTAFFVYESMEYPELGKATVTVDRSVVQKLNDIYINQRLAAWDGYSKYNKHILDGRGFSLNITFNDGKCISAHGMNAFPPHYEEFCTAISDALDPVRDALLKKKTVGEE